MTRDEIGNALKAAHAAGDEQGARILAKAYADTPITDTPALGPINRFASGVGGEVLNAAGNAVDFVRPGYGESLSESGAEGIKNATGTAGSIGKFVGSTVPYAMLPGGGVAKTALASGALSGLTSKGDDEARLKQAAITAALTGLVGGAAKGVTGFTPSKSASDLMGEGVQPTLGQGVKQNWLGRMIRGVEEASESLPFTGAITKNARDRGINEFAHRAIKEAELPDLGITAKGALGHEAIRNLKSGFNAAYTNALAGKTIAFKPQFHGNLTRAINNPSALLNPEERAQTTRYIQSQLAKMPSDATGKYNASDMHAVESEIGAKIRSLPVGDQRRSLLEDIKSTITSYRNSQLPAETNRDIAKIDKAYANFVRFRETAKGVGTDAGEFTPAQLYNKTIVMDKNGKAASGEALLQDLAGKGKRVFTSKTNDSGTAPRILTNKLLAGGALETGAAIANLPAALTGMGIAALGATRPVQKALLGGYKYQPIISELLRKSLTPASAGLLNEDE